MTLAHQQLSSDYDKLKQEESETSSKLQDLMYVSRALLLTDVCVDPKHATNQSVY